MYFFQVFLTLPGIALLFNSWLVLTVVFAGAAAVRLFEKEENRYLESRFGEAYSAYSERVPIKF